MYAPPAGSYLRMTSNPYHLGKIQANPPQNPPMLLTLSMIPRHGRKCRVLALSSISYADAAGLSGGFVPKLYLYFHILMGSLGSTIFFFSRPSSAPAELSGAEPTVFPARL